MTGYEYADNNPATDTDPSGLCAVDDGPGGRPVCAPQSELDGDTPGPKDVNPPTPTLRPLTESHQDGTDVFTDENGRPHFVAESGDSPAAEAALKAFNDHLEKLGIYYNSESGTGVQFMFQNDILGGPYKGVITGIDGKPTVTGTTADLIEVTRVNGVVKSVRSFDVTASNQDNIENIAKTINNKLVNGSKAQAENVIFWGRDSKQAQIVGARFVKNQHVYSVDPEGDEDGQGLQVYGGGKSSQTDAALKGEVSVAIQENAGLDGEDDPIFDGPP